MNIGPEAINCRRRLECLISHDPTLEQTSTYERMNTLSLTVYQGATKLVVMRLVITMKSSGRAW